MVYTVREEDSYSSRSQQEGGLCGVFWVKLPCLRRRYKLVMRIQLSCRKN